MLPVMLVEEDWWFASEGIREQALDGRESAVAYHGIARADVRTVPAWAKGMPGGGTFNLHSTMVNLSRTGAS